MVYNAETMRRRIQSLGRWGRVALATRQVGVWLVAGIVALSFSALSADSRTSSFPSFSHSYSASGGFLYSEYLKSVAPVTDVAADGVSAGIASSDPVSAGSFVVQTHHSVWRDVSEEVFSSALGEVNSVPVSEWALDYLLEDADIEGRLRSKFSSGLIRLSDLAAVRFLREVTDSAKSAGFVQNAEVDVQTSLGGRRAQAGASFLGALRETGEDAAAWQLRGYGAEDDGWGVNAGLIYRRSVGSALLGVNTFLDYETQDEEGFSRWSVGSEVRSAWLDLRFNHYRGLSSEKRVIDAEGIESILYSANGYDVEIDMHSPNLRWVSAVLAYYYYEGLEDGPFVREEEEGIRAGLRISPPDFPLVAELEYDRNSSDDKDHKRWGGKLSYLHEFGRPARGVRSGGEFSPSDYFFAPVRREHAQRIYRAEDPNAVGGGPGVRLFSLTPTGGVLTAQSTDPTLTIDITISAIDMNGAPGLTIVGMNGERVLAESVLQSRGYGLPQPEALTIETGGAVGGTTVTAHFVYPDGSTSVRIGSTVVFLRDGATREIVLLDGQVVVETGSTPVRTHIDNEDPDAPVATVIIGTGSPVTISKPTRANTADDVTVQTDAANVQVERPDPANSGATLVVSCDDPSSIANFTCPLLAPEYKEDNNYRGMTGINGVTVTSSNNLPLIRIRYSEILDGPPTGVPFASIRGRGGRAVTSGDTYIYEVVGSPPALLSLSGSEFSLKDTGFAGETESGTITMEITNAGETITSVLRVEVVREALEDLEASLVDRNGRPLNTRETSPLRVISHLTESRSVATVLISGGASPYTTSKTASDLQLGEGNTGSSVTGNETEVAIYLPASITVGYVQTLSLTVADAAQDRTGGGGTVPRTPDVPLVLHISVVFQQQEPAVEVTSSLRSSGDNTFVFNATGGDDSSGGLVTVVGLGAERGEATVRADYHYEPVGTASGLQLNSSGTVGVITFSGGVAPTMNATLTMTVSVSAPSYAQNVTVEIVVSHELEAVLRSDGQAIETASGDRLQITLVTGQDITIGVFNGVGGQDPYQLSRTTGTGLVVNGTNEHGLTITAPEGLEFGTGNNVFQVQDAKTGDDRETATLTLYYNVDAKVQEPGAEASYGNAVIAPASSSGVYAGTPRIVNERGNASFATVSVTARFVATASASGGSVAYQPAFAYAETSPDLAVGTDGAVSWQSGAQPIGFGTYTVTVTVTDGNDSEFEETATLEFLNISELTASLLIVGRDPVEYFSKDTPGVTIGITAFENGSAPILSLAIDGGVPSAYNCEALSEGNTDQTSVSDCLISINQQETSQENQNLILAYRVNHTGAEGAIPTEYGGGQTSFDITVTVRISRVRPAPVVNIAWNDNFVPEYSGSGEFGGQRVYATELREPADILATLAADGAVVSGTPSYTYTRFGASALQVDSTSGQVRFTTEPTVSGLHTLTVEVTEATDAGFNPSATLTIAALVPVQGEFLRVDGSALNLPASNILAVTAASNGTIAVASVALSGGSGDQNGTIERVVVSGDPSADILSFDPGTEFVSVAEGVTVGTRGEITLRVADSFNTASNGGQAGASPNFDFALTINVESVSVVAIMTVVSGQQQDAAENHLYQAHAPELTPDVLSLRVLASGGSGNYDYETMGAAAVIGDSRLEVSDRGVVFFTSRPRPGNIYSLTVHATDRVFPSFDGRATVAVSVRQGAELLNANWALEHNRLLVRPVTGTVSLDDSLIRGANVDSSVPGAPIIRLSEGSIRRGTTNNALIALLTISGGIPPYQVTLINGYNVRFQEHVDTFPEGVYGQLELSDSPTPRIHNSSEYDGFANMRIVDDSAQTLTLGWRFRISREFSPGIGVSVQLLPESGARILSQGRSVGARLSSTHVVFEAFPQEAVRVARIIPSGGAGRPGGGPGQGPGDTTAYTYTIQAADNDKGVSVDAEGYVDFNNISVGVTVEIDVRDTANRRVGDNNRGQAEDPNGYDVRIIVEPASVLGRRLQLSLAPDVSNVSASDFGSAGFGSDNLLHQIPFSLDEELTAPIFVGSIVRVVPGNRGNAECEATPDAETSVLFLDGCNIMVRPNMLQNHQTEYMTVSARNGTGDELPLLESVISYTPNYTYTDGGDIADAIAPSFTARIAVDATGGEREMPLAFHSFADSDSVLATILHENGSAVSQCVKFSGALELSNDCVISAPADWPAGAELHLVAQARNIEGSGNTQLTVGSQILLLTAVVQDRYDRQAGDPIFADSIANTITTTLALQGGGEQIERTYVAAVNDFGSTAALLTLDLPGALPGLGSAVNLAASSNDFRIEDGQLFFVAGRIGALNTAGNTASDVIINATGPGGYSRLITVKFQILGSDGPLSLQHSDAVRAMMFEDYKMSVTVGRIEFTRDIVDDLENPGMSLTLESAIGGVLFTVNANIVGNSDDSVEFGMVSCQPSSECVNLMLHPTGYNGIKSKFGASNFGALGIEKSDFLGRTFGHIRYGSATCSDTNGCGVEIRHRPYDSATCSDRNGCGVGIRHRPHGTSNLAAQVGAVRDIDLTVVVAVWRQQVAAGEPFGSAAQQTVTMVLNVGAPDEFGLSLVALTTAAPAPDAILTSYVREENNRVVAEFAGRYHAPFVVQIGVADFIPDDADLSLTLTDNSGYFEIYHNVRRVAFADLATFADGVYTITVGASYNGESETAMTVVSVSMGAAVVEPEEPDTTATLISDTVLTIIYEPGSDVVSHFNTQGGNQGDGGTVTQDAFTQYAPTVNGRDLSWGTLRVEPPDSGSIQTEYSLLGAATAGTRRAQLALQEDQIVRGDPQNPNGEGGYLPGDFVITISATRTVPLEGDPSTDVTQTGTIVLTMAYVISTQIYLVDETAEFNAFAHRFEDDDRGGFRDDRGGFRAERVGPAHYRLYYPSSRATGGNWDNSGYCDDTALIDDGSPTVSRDRQQVPAIFRVHVVSSSSHSDIKRLSETAYSNGDWGVLGFATRIADSRDPGARSYTIDDNAIDNQYRIGVCGGVDPKTIGAPVSVDRLTVDAPALGGPENNPALVLLTLDTYYTPTIAGGASQNLLFTALDRSGGRFTVSVRVDLVEDPGSSAPTPNPYTPAVSELMVSWQDDTDGIVTVASGQLNVRENLNVDVDVTRTPVATVNVSGGASGDFYDYEIYHHPSQFASEAGLQAAALWTVDESGEVRYLGEETGEVTVTVVINDRPEPGTVTVVGFRNGGTDGSMSRSLIVFAHSSFTATLGPRTPSGETAEFNSQGFFIGTITSFPPLPEDPYSALCETPPAVAVAYCGAVGSTPPATLTLVVMYSGESGDFNELEGAYDEITVAQPTLIADFNLFDDGQALFTVTIGDTVRGSVNYAYTTVRNGDKTEHFLFSASISSCSGDEALCATVTVGQGFKYFGARPVGSYASQAQVRTATLDHVEVFAQPILDNEVENGQYQVELVVDFADTFLGEEGGQSVIVNRFGQATMTVEIEQAIELSLSPIADGVNYYPPTVIVQQEEGVEYRYQPAYFGQFSYFDTVATTTTLATSPVRRVPGHLQGVIYDGQNIGALADASLSGGLGDYEVDFIEAGSGRSAPEFYLSNGRMFIAPEAPIGVYNLSIIADDSGYALVTTHPDVETAQILKLPGIIAGGSTLRKPDISSLRVRNLYVQASGPRGGHNDYVPGNPTASRWNPGRSSDIVGTYIYGDPGSGNSRTVALIENLPFQFPNTIDIMGGTRGYRHIYTITITVNGRAEIATLRADTVGIHYTEGAFYQRDGDIESPLAVLGSDYNSLAGPFAKVAAPLGFIDDISYSDLPKPVLGGRMMLMQSDSDKSNLELVVADASRGTDLVTPECFQTRAKAVREDENGNVITLTRDLHIAVVPERGDSAVTARRGDWNPCFLQVLSPLDGDGTAANPFIVRITTSGGNVLLNEFIATLTPPPGGYRLRSGHPHFVVENGTHLFYRSHVTPLPDSMFVIVEDRWGNFVDEIQIHLRVASGLSYQPAAITLDNGSVTTLLTGSGTADDPYEWNYVHDALRDGDGSPNTYYQLFVTVSINSQTGAEHPYARSPLLLSLTWDHPDVASLIGDAVESPIVRCESSDPGKHSREQACGLLPIEDPDFVSSPVSAVRTTVGTSTLSVEERRDLFFRSNVTAMVRVGDELSIARSGPLTLTSTRTRVSVTATNTITLNFVELEYGASDYEYVLTVGEGRRSFIEPDVNNDLVLHPMDVRDFFSRTPPQGEDTFRVTVQIDAGRLLRHDDGPIFMTLHFKFTTNLNGAEVEDVDIGPLHGRVKFETTSNGFRVISSGSRSEEPATVTYYNDGTTYTPVARISPFDYTGDPEALPDVAVTNPEVTLCFLPTEMNGDRQTTTSGVQVFPDNTNLAFSAAAAVSGLEVRDSSNNVITSRRNADDNSVVEVQFPSSATSGSTYTVSALLDLPSGHPWPSTAVTRTFTFTLGETFEDDGNGGLKDPQIDGQHYCPSP